MKKKDEEKIEKILEGDYKVRVKEMDGWIEIGENMKKKEKRGMVMVEKNFEKDGELESIEDGIEKEKKRFGGGKYEMWYKVKERREKERLERRMSEKGIKKIMKIEIEISEKYKEKSIDGKGMIVVNKKYKIESEMKIMIK